MAMAANQRSKMSRDVWKCYNASAKIGKRILKATTDQEHKAVEEFIEA
jgi:hypothetical protein